MTTIENEEMKVKSAQLRKETHWGILDCKRILWKNEGDYEKSNQEIMNINS